LCCAHRCSRKRFCTKTGGRLASAAGFSGKKAEKCIFIPMHIHNFFIFLDNQPLAQYNETHNLPDIYRFLYGVYRQLSFAQGKDVAFFLFVPVRASVNIR
jgi:hypothetical protein